MGPGGSLSSGRRQPDPLAGTTRDFSPCRKIAPSHRRALDPPWDLGVYLIYDKWDGRTRQKYSYAPKGDFSRLGEFVESLHGTPLSVGLFVSFPKAWKAVKEFMETDGELPTSIEWIATRDLPPETFPIPKPPSMLQRPSPPW
jgi:hypothetical protein